MRGFLLKSMYFCRLLSFFAVFKRKITNFKQLEPLNA